MLKEVIVVVLLMATAHGHSSFILQSVERNDDILEFTRVAFYMAKRFITNHTNTLIIMQRCEFLNDEQELYHEVMLQRFLYNLTYDLNIQLYFAKPNDRPWDYNMFIIDSWWAFESLRLRLPPTKHERQFYFFILLTWPWPTPGTATIQMERIFNVCLQFNVKNVVIMYRIPKSRYISFYSYQIYNTDHCQERITIEEVNRYEGGRLLYDFLFPQHISNFHGCSLTVTGHIIHPLLTFNGNINNKKHLGNLQRLGGIEGEILKMVAKVLNFKIKLRIPQRLNVIGMHMNSSGSFEDLEREHAQIAIGGLSATMLDSYKFSYSYAYHTTPYVFVIRGGNSFGPIKQLLNPLCYETWLLILGLIIASIIFTAVVERYWKPKLRNFIFGPCNQHPLRNLTLVLVGSPIPEHIVPTRTFARFLFMAWLLLTFELRNGYQGKLFDSLRLAKRLPVPQTIAELNALDYTLLANAYTTFYPANKTQIMANPTMRMLYINESEERVTTTALLDILIHFNSIFPKTSSLTYVKENIHFYQCVLFFPKHSLLRPSFDQIFKKLTDAGITSYIAQRQIQRRFLNKRGRVPQSRAGKITNRNLHGLYFCYALLCGLATIVFVLEMLTKKWKKLKAIMDWWN